MASRSHSCLPNSQTHVSRPTATPPASMLRHLCKNMADRSTRFLAPSQSKAAKVPCLTSCDFLFQEVSPHSSCHFSPFQPFLPFRVLTKKSEQAGWRSWQKPKCLHAKTPAYRLMSSPQRRPLTVNWSSIDSWNWNFHLQLKVNQSIRNASIFQVLDCFTDSWWLGLRAEVQCIASLMWILSFINKGFSIHTFPSG